MIQLLFIILWGQLGFCSPERELKLPILLKKQERALSCEAAALSSALSVFKMDVSEKEVIKKMPFDHTPNKDGVWGDPNEAFVGDIDGHNIKMGYGIHWNPLARLASHWVEAKIVEKGTIKTLVENILLRRPVIIWIPDDGIGRPLFWTTPSGKKIEAIETEHTVVVYGFRGSADKPSGFYIMDPEHGFIFWKTRELMKRWGRFHYKGVVLNSKKST